eukprot:CAMPEP_0184484254 /NCGR_PEP_ID=MMETSP0113_2-20130426/5980_1 /TAXON_ID=91329 /ORGANISM="Norrisiella sphaerica, Strain BC52" /LENGTH=712 /DNA_ID=CAMNT_0026865169 /DNA_START=47 /DNA_END=2185 /DNA_ORIENTATION=+
MHHSINHLPSPSMPSVLLRSMCRWKSGTDRSSCISASKEIRHCRLYPSSSSTAQFHFAAIASRRYSQIRANSHNGGGIRPIDKSFKAQYLFINRYHYRPLYKGNLEGIRSCGRDAIARRSVMGINSRASSSMTGLNGGGVNFPDDPNSPPRYEAASKVLDLTEEEKEIFSHLRNVVEYHNLSTVVRVAGGWVRDKLLGLDSDDIDIAVDNMEGEMFAQLVNRYIEETGIMPSSKVSVIKTNPDKSKHLATATFRIGARPIDVNHLRSEEYSTSSRIPEVKMGTPYEDAFRRDLTINALYYNVNSDIVEDFTNRGFEDLKARIARTPLAPLETLVDDPLRLLRTLRFAGRFGLDIDPKFDEAARDPEVKKGLITKVSRERFGQEIIKALSGPGRPSKLLCGLLAYGVDSIIFANSLNGETRLSDNGASLILNPTEPLGLPPLLSPAEPRTIRTDLSLRSVERMQSYLEKVSMEDIPGLPGDTPGEAQRRLLLAAFFLPYHGVAVEKLVKKTIRAQSAVFTFLVEGIKYPHRDAQEVDDMVQSCMQLRQLTYELRSYRKQEGLVLVPASDASPISPKAATGVPMLRLNLGLLLESIKDLWIPALDLARVVEAALVAKDSKSNSLPGPPLTSADFDFLEAWAKDVHLERIWETPKLLDGKEIVKLFGVSGKEIGTLVQAQRAWQILNPDASRQQCLEYLKGVVRDYFVSQHSENA